ncbi:MAG: helix-turn-helix domain-containing protein, partial [Actinobacteria bacterium]|nr:helix-turn-helix domain-containing protein [Actinomycetota bacterium]
ARALATLDAARKLGRARRVTSPADLGVYRLLVTAADRDDLLEFGRRTLEPLVRHDRERGTRLLDTLRDYVDSGFNQRATARRSYVHVNTVAYRLRSIEGLLDADLTDPDQLLGLTLALRVTDLAGGG